MFNCFKKAKKGKDKDKDIHTRPRAPSRSETEKILLESIFADNPTNKTSPHKMYEEKPSQKHKMY